MLIGFLESGGGSANATASSSLDKDVDDESGCSVASAAKSGSAESVHHQHGSGGKVYRILFLKRRNYKKSFRLLIYPGSNTPVQPRTASIRARPTSSRITAAELEELFQRQQGGGSGGANGENGSGGSGTGSAEGVMTSRFQNNMSQPGSPAARTPRVYASVAEMKRSKGKVRI